MKSESEMNSSYDYEDEEDESTNNGSETTTNDDDLDAVSCSSGSGNQNNKKQEPTRASSKRARLDLTCVVCGAAANGYNFDAISCESCKAFFRRNAFRQLSQLRCPSDGQCVINVLTRKKCKRCRIIKCFSVGMRRDWIMTDGEKRAKKRKCETAVYESNDRSQHQNVPVRRRRRRRQTTNQSNSSRTIQMRAEKSYYKQSSPIETSSSSSLADENLLKCSASFNYYNLQQSYATTQYYLPTVSSSFFPSFSSLIVANANANANNYFQPSSYYHPSLTDSTSNSCCSSLSSSNSPPQSCLSDEQKETIKLVQTAYNQSVELVKAINVPRGVDKLDTLVNLYELPFRRLLIFFKKVPDYSQLPEQLSCKLLIGNWMKLLLINAVASFDKEKNAFKVSLTDDVSFEIDSIRENYGAEALGNLLDITNHLYSLLDGNFVFQKILLLVAIFDTSSSASAAAVDNWSAEEKSTVEQVQSKYLALLYAYSRECFGSPRAELNYKEFILQLSKLNDLSRLLLRTTEERVDAIKIRPLMRELLLLPRCKQHHQS